MVKLSGSVNLRKVDDSIGLPISQADLIFESPNGQGNTYRTKTDSQGRYEIEVNSNEILATVENSDFGTSQRWTKVVNLNSDGSNTLNLFIPDLEKRLKNLVSSYPGEFGLYALNLNSGKEFSLNSDSLMYLASVSKIAIAIGCVDLMTSPSDINKKIKLELYHHREEGKLVGENMGIQYQDLGQEVSLDLLFRRMLGMSDTSATDILCEHFGISRINKRIKELNIAGIEEFSSMIQLDRRRWWLSDKNVGFLPQFAFSLYQRQRIPYWLEKLNLPKPRIEPGKWEEYLSERRDRATTKAYGEILKRIANKNLLTESWKNDLLLNTIITYGGYGRFSGIVDNTKIIDSKGGSHHQVRNQAGIIRDKLTKAPIAILVAFTQKNEISKKEADNSLKAASDLALKYIGIDDKLQEKTVKDEEIRFVAPAYGLTFVNGEIPFIRWKSKGISGPLKLSLIKRNGSKVLNISDSVKNDGEWHSFKIPENLAPDDTYQFKLVGKDNDDDEVEAFSAFFTIGGTIHLIHPVTGSNLRKGSKPTISWLSSGINGKLKITLKDQQNNSLEITSNARNDGEWHSWEVPNRLDKKWGYFLNISCIENPEIFDNSGLFFIGGRINVISPKPYEIWKKGSKPKIEWESEGVEGPLTIQLIGRSNNIITITSNANDDGEWHSWEIPDIESGQGYRIAIFETGSPEIRGYSELFQVGTVYEWDVPSVEQSPFASWAASGRPHYFKYNEDVNLKWRRIGPSAGNLKIELLKDNRRLKLLASNALDDGEWHSWKPESDLTRGSNYQLKISNNANDFGLSVPFSIGANIDVHISTLRPKLNENPTINWVTQNISDDLSIHVVKKNGDEILISNVARDDGEWRSWTISDDTPKGWARIRIRSNRFNDVFGYSEWFKVV